MKTASLALLLIALTGCAGPLYEHPGAALSGPDLHAQAMEYNLKGNEASSAGNQEAAVQWYTQAIQAKPSDAVLWQNRGISLWALDRYQEAHADFREVMRLKPHDTVWKFPNAREWLRGKTMPVEHAAAMAASWAGIALGNAGKADEALAWYEKALEDDPSMPYVWWNRGTCRAAKGDPAGARQDLDRWLEFDPGYAPFRDACDLQIFQDRPKVVSQEEEAGSQAEAEGSPLAAFQHYAKAYAFRTYLLENEAARWRSIADLVRTAGQAKPPPPLHEEARRFLVFAGEQVKAKDYAAAEASYRKLLYACPWHAAAYRNRALVLAELGDLPFAIEVMQRYLDLFPEAADAREARDTIYQWEAKGGKALKTGLAWKTWFGFGYEAKDGAISVSRVIRASPAGRAGRKAGDQLASAAGTAVTTLEQMAQAFASKVPGNTLALVAKRGGKEIPLTLIAAHRALGR